MRINELPTPCYVIDEGVLKKNLEILKKVREDTGCRILLAQKAFSCFHEYPLIGEVKENQSHYDLMNAVMICLGDDPENQDNNILKLLEVLLSNDAKASEKKKILTEEFDISMSEKFEGEVAKMCNISEGVVEKTWRRGIETGERRGEERNSIKLISNLMKNASLTFDQAAAMLGIPDSDREEYRKLVGKKID